MKRFAFVANSFLLRDQLLVRHRLRPHKRHEGVAEQIQVLAIVVLEHELIELGGKVLGPKQA